MTGLEPCLEFLRSILRTPGMPGEEGEVARLVATEMERLGYDEVRTDEAGNVIGTIRGRGEAPAVMFNTHLDHVDAGDESAWLHPPFGAELADGRLWGRGAVDIKGPLAAQVHGVARLLADDEPPPGDVYVSAVVQEEIGGLGARHLVERLKPPLVVVGEPSSNELRRGHRGRVEFRLHARGRSAHASAPARGVNPLAVVARFLLALEELEMPEDPELGPATVAPTLFRTDQRSRNVIPGETWLTLDWRNVPGERAEEIRSRLQELADGSRIEGATAEIEIPVHRRRSYTGLEADVPDENPPYSLPADHPALELAATVLEPALGRRPPTGTWTFATDGGHFARAGLTVIGFGPGEEALAHTVRESIAVSEIEEALAGNAALAREWPARMARHV